MRMYDGESLRDVDLAQALTHLNRNTSAKRAKLAEHPLTLAYVEAGRSLIQRQFASAGELDASGRPVIAQFKWLTRDLLFREVDVGPSGLHASEGTYRDRWEVKDDFIADLVKYTFLSSHWSLTAANSSELAELLTSGTLPFGDAIEEVAYSDLELILTEETATNFRAQLSLQPYAPRDLLIKAAVDASYAELARRWGALYGRVLKARGLTVRNELTLEQMTTMLTAVAEGLALRIIAGHHLSVMDSEKRTSLLGTVAMALVLTCLTSADDHRTVRDLFDQTVEQQSDEARP